MRAPLNVLPVLLCSAYIACFDVACLYKATHPPHLYNYIVIFVIYPIGSPLFFQFSQTGAGVETGEGFFSRAELMAKLQVGHALKCSSHLGLGSAVPAPMFLGTQPPYATNPLTIDKVGMVSRLMFLYKSFECTLAFRPISSPLLPLQLPDH